MLFLFFSWIFRGLDLLCHMVFTGETTSGAGHWEGTLFSFKSFIIIPPIVFMMLPLSIYLALDPEPKRCQMLPKSSGLSYIKNPC
ncbi:hypothetical protein M431DRAFT_327052 [Trichoderma harzianum CBS 226.95]|uniref:Uncharacterized protein n=1 Tax=Trichoderma harzianum CBS 226.95 TaxID=983964 RepID=A0A2T3ZUE5_TRIHA|nr:hypothetical protein M431DRAFT_327052 [Trichoderma harzianum CBS 226.95]PTB48440.1 hypothetical protein M431DRAFT_327052 [Trichoderma harzianum CBS 226.95]